MRRGSRMSMQSRTVVLESVVKGVLDKECSRSRNIDWFLILRVLGMCYLEERCMQLVPRKKWACLRSFQGFFRTLVVTPELEYHLKDNFFQKLPKITTPIIRGVS